jgi:hypothetical protein
VVARPARDGLAGDALDARGEAAAAGVGHVDQDTGLDDDVLGRAQGHVAVGAGESALEAVDAPGARELDDLAVLRDGAVEAGEEQVRRGLVGVDDGLRHLGDQAGATGPSPAECVAGQGGRGSAEGTVGGVARDQGAHAETSSRLRTTVTTFQSSSA